MKRRFADIVYWCAVAMLLLYRPVFMMGVPFSAFPGAEHDDGLMLRLALSLKEGNWLGAYDELTLIKGPFYPMFVAAVGSLRVPLPVFEQALYSVIALVAAWSIRPIVPSRWMLLLGIALMVLNPYSWGPVPARFARDPMAAQMALLSMAGVVGMILRRDRAWYDIAAWGALAGMAGAACWMTREEGLWIVAPAGALLVVAAVLVKKERRGWRRAAAVVVWPAMMGALPVLSVCAENHAHYGVLGVIELKTRTFQDAYGALLRVGEKHHRPYVPVSAAAREQMYKASPTFAELRPMLEGELGQKWMMHRPMPDPQDMQGGWFVWAFREAVTEVAGQRTTPPMDYYRRIADEVNAACDAGRLECGAARSGLTTPFHREDWPRLRESMRRFFWRLAWWRTYRADMQSIDDRSSMALAARDLVKTRLTGEQNVPMVRGWACAAEGPVTLAIMENGLLAKFKSQRFESPDVAEFMKASGKNWDSAKACRFVQVARPEATHLVIYGGAVELGRIDLGASERMIMTDQVAASVDEFDRDVEPIMTNHKRVVRSWVNRAYYVLQPVWVAMVAVWFAIGLATIRRNFLLVCITVAVAGAIALRSGLLAYIDATTYTIPDSRYQEPTYTMLAYLMVLCIGALWHRLASLRATRSTAANSVGVK